MRALADIQRTFTHALLQPVLRVPDAVGEMLVKRNLAVVEAPVAVDPPRPVPAPAKPADPPKHDDRRAEFVRKADKKDEDDD